MLKNLDFLWCCGNSNALKQHNLYTVALNPIDSSHPNMRSTNQCLLENDMSLPIMGSLPLKTNEDVAKDIVMGKSASDIDIIGLS